MRSDPRTLQSLNQGVLSYAKCSLKGVDRIFPPYIFDFFLKQINIIENTSSKQNFGKKEVFQCKFKRPFLNKMC